MKHTILIGLSSLGIIFNSCGQFILSPRSGASGGNAYPFVPAPDVAPSVRYQQVYGSSDFTAPRGPFLITAIRFAGGTGSLGIDANLPNVRIDFSTSGRNPDGLSTVFAENVGADNTVVYSGPLRFYDRGILTFDIRIPLQTPFRYDAEAGNLLMDVRNFQTVPFSFTGPRFMVGSDVLGDTASSQWSRDVNSASATVVDTGGLLTMFEVTLVPEPATCFVLLLVFTLVRMHPEARRWLTGFRRPKGIRN